MSRQEIYDTRLAHSRSSGECRFKPRYGNSGCPETVLFGTAKGAAWAAPLAMPHDKLKTTR
jgi:hypothetical protein